MQDIAKNISGIPERLRDIVAKSGLSQAKFAEFIDEPKHRLTDVLRGQIRLPSDMLQKILTRTDADAVWLMTGQSVDVGELTPAEKITISNLRGCSEAERDVFRRAIAALAATRTGT